MPCVFVRISRILLTDQFIACGKSRDVAHDLASLIWIAVLDNLEENERTFALLKRLSQEGDVSATHTTIPADILFCNFPLLPCQPYPS